MYASINDVDEIAGVSVDLATLKKAQAIIETASGRPEELVTDTTDLIWLKKATAYQCAYMEDDPTSVFEQPNLESITQGQNKMVMGNKPVWLSPVAQKAIGNLSWRKSRFISFPPTNYRREQRRQDLESDRMRHRWWAW
ncbi:hypothetical protein OHS59_31780 [Streptomyces sp. NBC_00414]|uniref:hypothetical protein n=1 Tax=Streptomyces sp. NBC_00414 TaxID=2975739 RepID=UPI002E242E7D